MKLFWSKLNMSHILKKKATTDSNSLCGSIQVICYRHIKTIHSFANRNGHFGWFKSKCHSIGQGTAPTKHLPLSSTISTFPCTEFRHKTSVSLLELCSCKVLHINGFVLRTGSGTSSFRKLRYKRKPTMMARKEGTTGA